MDTTYLVVAGLCLVGLAIRSSYEVLKHSGRVDPTSTAVFAVVLVGMIAMLGSWPILCALDPWRHVVPGAARWAGLGTVLVALGLAVGGLVQLRGVENIDHLVSTGLYARLRHPMYVGFSLWMLGWVLRHGAIGSLLVALVCIGNILYWRSLEERAMEARYGADYRSYRQGTWC